MSVARQLACVKNCLPEGTVLVAVSKTHPVEAIREAYEVGQRIFGESRPQELLAKYEALPRDIEWHMIGHLQTNKVKYIAPFVRLIHSVDSARLAETIQREASKCGRTIDILLEIRVADEETKSGWDIGGLMDYLRSAPFALMPNVCVRGVMGHRHPYRRRRDRSARFRRTAALLRAAAASFRRPVRYAFDGHVARLSAGARPGGYDGAHRIAHFRGAGLFRTGRLRGIASAERP